MTVELIRLRYSRVLSTIKDSEYCEMTATTAKKVKEAGVFVIFMGEKTE